jgi:hypothetical protein
MITIEFGSWRPGAIAAAAVAGVLVVATPASAVTSSVSLTSSRSVMTLGETVRESGAVSPAQPGKVVSLQRYSGGAWHTIANQALNGYSRYSFTTRPTATGTWTFRTVKPVFGSYSRAVSASRTVRVVPRPTVSLSFASAAIDAGTGPTLTYGTSGVPAGYAVRLQRQFGTAAVWRDVQPLALSGTTTAPSLTMGKYIYRVGVIAPTGVLVAWQQGAVAAYGDVPLTQLMQVQSHTVQIGTQLFRYAYEFGSGTTTFLHMDSTSCRSVRFSVGKTGTATSNGGSVDVVQETADAQSLHVMSNEVKAFTASLTGDAVDLNISDTSGDDGYTYVDGVLSCYTADGMR